jgi:hypothetical protein
VISSFYQPRYYVERRDRERALAILEIAEMIHPGHPRVCLQRAYAWAIDALAREAARELDCARRAGVLTPAVLADRAFDRIRDAPEFRALATSAAR